MMFFLSGCAGTLVTRYWSHSGSSVGAYPYQAVAYDFKEAHDDFDFNSVLVLLCFLPLDVTVDTILLPVDLIAWPFGKKKQEGSMFS